MLISIFGDSFRYNFQHFKSISIFFFFFFVLFELFMNSCKGRKSNLDLVSYYSTPFCLEAIFLIYLMRNNSWKSISFFFFSHPLTNDDSRASRLKEKKKNWVIKLTHLVNFAVVHDLLTTTLIYK